jgi:hypothetical protein
MAIGRISGQMLKANLLRSGTDLAFETNLLVLDVTNSFVGIGTATPSRQLHISGTGAIRLPSGSDAQRGTAAAGDIRYNSDRTQIEGYVGGAWVNLGAGAQVLDTEGNTGIDVERTSDENQIHFFVEGQGDVAHIRSNGNIELNNLNIASQTVTGLVTNADIVITPNGTGSVAMTKVNIDGGSIDGTTIGSASASTGSFTDLTGNGTISITGTTTGSMNNVAIGASTQASGKFTTVESTGDITVGGNLIVNGTTTTVDTETLSIEDPLIVLAKNNSGGSANIYDEGLLFNRGSLSNVAFFWDESADEFVFATTAAETGSTAGNITIDSYQQLKAGIIKANTSLDTGAIKAADGTAAATIANSTGVITVGSSVLTTTDINGGTIDGTVIGGASRAAGSFTTVDANDHITISADSKELRIGAGTDLTITHDGTNTTIDNNTGILKILGAASSSIQINSDAANVDTQISGDTDAELIYVDASADKIGISTATPAYILDIASTDAVRLPTGANATRPTAATGVIRFNTDSSAYEGSTDGSTWSSFAMGGGGVAAISKVSATGDGSTSTFTGFFASSPATAANVMVYIDNVYQEPTENYTVSSNNITFTSAPHSGARIFALVGFDAGSMTTGGVARTQTDSVSFTSSATALMTYNATSYRSAELFITITDAGNTEYSCMKANVVHDGTTAYISVYGIVNTGGSDTATLTATLSGATVTVAAISTGGVSSAMVQYSLQAV